MKECIPRFSKETVQPPVVAVSFFKLGGTWDMVERADGKLIGSGNLDDPALLKLEHSFGLATPGRLQKSELVGGEKQLAQAVYTVMKATPTESEGLTEHVASWLPGLEQYVSGPFTAIFSGDSSHLRPSLIAPMVSILIEQALKEPQKTILGAQGTDTADVALVGVIDALTFDTQLAPVILTGSNRSHREPNSDAIGNFTDLAKVAHKNIGPGAFWLFHGKLFMASDFVKADPQETRRIEGASTFWAPQQTSVEVSSLLHYGSEVDVSERKSPSPKHITRKLTMESLYDAMVSVCTVDLGNQNNIASEVEQILNPENRTIVVAAHSLGNVNDEIRAACVEAAKQGKVVIVASRSVVGEVNKRYAGSLLDANENSEELQGTGTQVISGQKLNKTAARAIAVRTLLEGCTQEQTQQLVDQYYSARFLQ